jgi:adenylate cyclase
LATEIERKFLVRDERWRKDADAGVAMRQGYLVGSERASVRVRIAGAEAFLNIKSATLGIRRLEYEVPLPLEDAAQLLDALCAKPLIEKTRFHVQAGRHCWEIDVFHGDNAGLVVAEIELADENEDFVAPPWLGEEVSHDARYYNSSLARHPYKDWT